jgi:cysteine dioxygenase
MEAISTIDELIQKFDEAEPSKRPSILKNINIPIADFAEFATWEDESYTRNCITRKDGFEFILLCWAPGSVTPIHGHDNQDCWVYQVSGSVEERRFEKTLNGELKESHEMSFDQGALAYMHDRMGYHSIENKSNKPAMTLHVYANPIDSCEVFNDDKNKFEVREMQYDTYEGNPVKHTGT